jgi:hypothetical protein
VIGSGAIEAVEVDTFCDELLEADDISTVLLLGRIKLGPVLELSPVLEL